MGRAVSRDDPCCPYNRAIPEDLVDPLLQQAAERKVSGYSRAVLRNVRLARGSLKASHLLTGGLIAVTRNGTGAPQLTRPETIILPIILHIPRTTQKGWSFNPINRILDTSTQRSSIMKITPAPDLGTPPLRILQAD
jgi:hypothetical protein